MITPLPGVWPTKPGSATLPFFGVLPVVLNDKGEELEGPAEVGGETEGKRASVEYNVGGEFVRGGLTRGANHWVTCVADNGLTCLREDALAWTTGRTGHLPLLCPPGHLCGM